MIYETIKLRPEYEATLTAYVFEELTDIAPHTRPSIVVCPGGGYRFLSDREAEPIVSAYLGAGFNVFLLHYTVLEGAADYAPLIQAATAIAYVRENAERYFVDPDRVFIVGFSAGGHLAASSAILWKHERVLAALSDKPYGSWKPTGAILSYPVITAGEFTHRGSVKNLSGREDYTDEDIARWSLELHVDADSAPAFIWHTATDKTVPVENSLMLAAAYSKHKVPFELHVYPFGPHGLSLANGETANGKADHVIPHLQGWVDLSVKWANYMTAQ
ncbi:MAG: alpha/beta hydrolase [Clostridia bacterium]|nr:alpha/beta hydrolase [Clostridia bacterium]